MHWLQMCIRDRDVDYMENICSLVLLQSLGCLISKKQLTDLTLTRTDTEEVRRYFSDDPAETIGDKEMCIRDSLSGRFHYYDYRIFLRGL